MGRANLLKRIEFHNSIMAFLAAKPSIPLSAIGDEISTYCLPALANSDVKHVHVIHLERSTAIYTSQTISSFRLKMRIACVLPSAQQKCPVPPHVLIFRTSDRSRNLNSHGLSLPRSKVFCRYLEYGVSISRQKLRTFFQRQIFPNFSSQRQTVSCPLFRHLVLRSAIRFNFCFAIFAGAFFDPIFGLKANKRLKVFLGLDLTFAFIFS